MRHLVLIPSYNSGWLVVQTVHQARAAWTPVWVIVDGSTDGTADALIQMAAHDSGLRVIVLPRNAGKGAALLHGMRLAVAEGFTHALTCDADGQHAPGQIGPFIAASRCRPDALILGVPVFGAEAPSLRVGGRKISNWWAQLESGGDYIGDSLFGFRVYPMAPLLRIMDRTRWMRRFDFEPEAAVRLVWSGLPTINLPAPVRYLSPGEGGVSHFRYVRDNILLTAMHVRLMVHGLLWHLPTMLRLGQKPAAHRPPATAPL